MAKRKDPIYATAFTADGKPETIITNPLKESDCEPWNASDRKKAQMLLSRSFPDRNPEDAGAMVAMLKKDIGQDWPEIEEAIKQFILKEE